MLLKKIKTIILSRILKPKTDQWVKDRRLICKSCPYNTLNMEKLTYRIKIAKFFSDLYTFTTFNKKTELGVCSVCTCDLYYKTETMIEYCEKGKWQKVDGGIKLEVRKNRKLNKNENRNN